MEVLKETNLKNIGELVRGKVRDIYVQDDKLILVSTDRHSSFDRIIAHIPHKGEVLNRLSVFWFDKLRDIIPNHLLEIPDPNVSIVRKCNPLAVEVVVRGYITGVTETSLWTHYEKGQRDFGDFTLPEELKKNQKLAEPVITPTTKSSSHDRPITSSEIIGEGFLTRDQWDKVSSLALNIFKKGEEVALSAGLILVDTKYEFGFDDQGSLLLIDEVHTPDSSRYWQSKSYKQRLESGKEPEYFDKEFLRLWFRENSNPYEDEALPPAPENLVSELSRRYIGIFEQLTGSVFKKSEPEVDVLERIEKNLKDYVIS
jgi:phosphoribosylaminoimidazole-succinocarboxamide synthase